MNLDEMTIKEAQQRLAEAVEIRKMMGLPSEQPSAAVAHHPFVGHAVFIRLVTHHYTGKCVAVTANEIVLTDASWIAEDGRFYDALKTGELSEVEPFPSGEVRIGYGALLDWHRWHHALPMEQK